VDEVTDVAEQSGKSGQDARLEVLIVGGGVGALEALLALHDLAEERVALTLLCPGSEFRYRPASVAVPFGRGEVLRYALADIADAVGARLVSASLQRVDAVAHRAFTDAGVSLAYDAVVIASGARRVPALQGALVFRGEEDVEAIAGLLRDITSGVVKRVVFGIPRAASWQLPLYELALLTAAHIDEHGVDGVSLDLVTPERQPLSRFGGEVSTAVEQLLVDRHIVLHTSTYPVEVYEGGLVLVPLGKLPADCVVSVPEARGVAITGLPHDHEGFLATDDHGRVRGVDDVYAIGDITNFPIKQGGIAAQQADLVAQVIAKRSGAQLDDPPPFHPVLRGLLLTGDAPQYLYADLTGGHGSTATTSTEPLWQLGGKIAADHLGRYLAHAPTVDELDDGP
jgi:sulfide:quinone oxidoreductase